MYQRILVTTDGAPLSDKAVAAAIDMAVLCQAELIALRVVHRYERSYFDGAATRDSDEVARIEGQWVDAARETVNAIKTRAESQGVRARAVVVKSGIVSEAVIGAAKKHDVDLIVMASHGRSGVKKVLLGSATQHVLTHSDIPVLVLR